jgi:hypothetical protein
MIQRELNYRLPFKRLVRLGRSADRKAYRTVSLLTQVWLVMKLTRFRGHPRICVEGVHDAKQRKEARTISA